jgi:hypothetical protein
MFFFFCFFFFFFFFFFLCLRAYSGRRTCGPESVLSASEQLRHAIHGRTSARWLIGSSAAG